MATRGRAAGLALGVAVALVMASCSPAVAPPTVSPTIGPDLSPIAAAPPTAMPTPAAAARWEDAGTLRLGRMSPRAVGFGSGGALVVGNDTGDCLRENSVITETWLPEEWWANPVDLQEPRSDFAAVGLADGRVLVTGGVDRGTFPNAYRFADFSPDSRPIDAGHRSLASTWVYARIGGEASWSGAASLGTARTSPIAAALPDGRVLVAGGYFLGASRAGFDREVGGDAPITAQSAAFRSSPWSGPVPRDPVLANDGPQPTVVPAMATAELYDPATDTWTGTGPMRYARYDAPAVTLTDGRVLVVGSGGKDWEPRWNYSAPDVDERAAVTAEVYDPATGRFTPAGELPPIDRAAMEALGLSEFSAYRPRGGTLFALAGGDALLVGRADDWTAGGGGGGGTMVRTLRFDGTDNRWTLVDQTVEIRWSDDEPDRDGTVVPGHVRYGALAGQLGDGRILVAGGQQLAGRGSLAAVDSAELYDPQTGSWTALPPMPMHRSGGATVTLGDGSVLLVGGTYETQRSYDCTEGPTGLVSALRFVPGS